MSDAGCILSLILHLKYVYELRVSVRDKVFAIGRDRII